jgi:hypothetical protein
MFHGEQDGFIAQPVAAVNVVAENMPAGRSNPVFHGEHSTTDYQTFLLATIRAHD